MRALWVEQHPEPTSSRQPRDIVSFPSQMMDCSMFVTNGACCVLMKVSVAAANAILGSGRFRAYGEISAGTSVAGLTTACLTKSFTASHPLWRFSGNTANVPASLHER